MSVRAITIRDLPELWLFLVKDAWPQMQYPPEGPNRAHFVGFWEKQISMGLSISFLSEQGGELCGVLLGQTFPDIYSGIPVAGEHLWYCVPGNAKEAIPLFRAFLKEAKRRGCIRVCAGDWQPNGGVDLSAIYRRHGFRMLERFYVKEL